MKIICESCESCETVFKAEAVKGMTNCPVCGAAFDEEEGNATYSYTDVLTRTIDLQVFDGENYSSIVPPKVIEPKKIKGETEEGYTEDLN